MNIPGTYSTDKTNVEQPLTLNLTRPNTRKFP